MASSSQKPAVYEDGSIIPDILAHNLELAATNPNTLSGFLFLRFREEFTPAVLAWLASEPFLNPDAPPSPFDMPEYDLAARQLAEDLQDEAEQFAQDARDADQTSDNYVITTVLAALVLFFAGVSTKLIRPRNRVLLLSLAIIVLIGTMIRVFSLPIEL